MATDLKSLFGGILTPETLQAQQAAQEQAALQYYAQQSDRPWQFLLERSLNNISAALPNSRQNQEKARAMANEEVLKRSTAKYGQMVQEGADPGKAQLEVLDSAIAEFAQSGNYEAISALAPTYLSLQAKQAEMAKLAQDQKTAYANELKTRTETELAPALAVEKIQTGQSTRTYQAAQTKKINQELQERETVNIIDLTSPETGPIATRIDPTTGIAQGVNGPLKETQYKLVDGKGGPGGGSGKPMTSTVQKQLETAGLQLDLSDELVTTFKPSFGGYGKASAGDAALDLKRNIFGDNTGAAEWWAKHQSKTQEVRHGLYGASFTAAERDEWLKQAPTPGMQPDVIMARLKAQQAVEEKVASRRGRGWAKSYDPEQVEIFLGRPVDFLEKRQSADTKKSDAPPAIDSLMADPKYSKYFSK